MGKFLKVALVLILLVAIVSCTLGPDDRKKKKEKKSSKNIDDAETQKPLKQDQNSDNGLNNKNLAELSVIDRNLAVKDINSPKDIVANHDLFCSSCATKKTFNQKVLGYVTPWNSKGYDIAKNFGHKLDMVSPVWLQIQRTGRKKYKLTGTHDIDKNWIKDVRQKSNSFTSIIPRILFEKLKMEDIHALFNEEEEIEALSLMLVKKSEEYGFDGYVFEIYLQLAGQGKTGINHLVRDLAVALHVKNKKLYLVIPPPLPASDDEKNINVIFDKDDFDILKDVIDGFSLMTYDYSSHNSIVGPNAPIDWVEKNTIFYGDDPKYLSKILIGLNFYGMKFVMDGKGRVQSQPEPIVGHSFIDLLNKNRVQIKYDDKLAEHFFIAKEGSNQAYVFYPTLYSIKQRIDLANRLGCGLSIWELGQGLDYFYDLL